MHRIISAAGATLVATTLVGCAGTAAEPVTVTDHTIIVDVRTADEYAQGHLEGATLLDLSGGQLADAIPTLDPDAEYLVYCRSGNRSVQAVELMHDAGLTDVTDLGSLSEAAEATQLPTTR